MLKRFIPRLLVIGFMFALVGISLPRFSVHAAERTEWTDTVTIEDALVQSCYGFNITGSYTADRAFHIVEEYSGHQVYERRDVTFAGALGNATTGKSFAYDGSFTRTASPELDKVTLSNLSLRFEVGTPGEFAVSFKRVDFELADNPHAVVKAIVPNVLQMDLCQLFGGSTLGNDQIKGTYPSPIDNENTAPNEPVGPYDERSVSNPSSNDSSGDDALPCEPRKGYPEDCATDW